MKIRIFLYSEQMILMDDQLEGKKNNSLPIAMLVCQDNWHCIRHSGIITHSLLHFSANV